MTDIPTFGELTDLDQLDVDPFPVPIVSYRVIDDARVPVRNTFTFRAMRPFKALADFLEASAAQGGLITLPTAHPFVVASLIDDDERERFSATMDEPDLYTDAMGLIELADWLATRYLGRPTRPGAGSSRGPGRTNGSSARRVGAKGGAR